MNDEIVMIMGISGAGKSTIVTQYDGYTRLNRDTVGGSLDDLNKLLEAEINKGGRRFVLDNTYGTVARRAGVLDVGKRHKIPVRCVHLTTSIEDAEVNVCMRMLAKYGRILGPEEITKMAKNDSSLVPTATLFGYRKDFEKPTPEEGFSKIENVKFVRQIDPSYNGEAYIFDFDGTLRTCKDPNQKYPVLLKDIVILPNRKKKLKQLHKEGKFLLGVSNQGDVGRGKVTLEAVTACFAHTVKLLEVPIEVAFCPHSVPPIKCYCRKPMPGHGIAFIEKHELNRQKTFMVGDMTTDKTFAARCGIQFIDEAEFFK